MARKTLERLHAVYILMKYVGELREEVATVLKPSSLEKVAPSSIVCREAAEMFWLGIMGVKYTLSFVGAGSSTTVAMRSVTNKIVQLALLDLFG